MTQPDAVQKWDSGWVLRFFPQTLLKNKIRAEFGGFRSSVAEDHSVLVVYDNAPLGNRILKFQGKITSSSSSTEMSKNPSRTLIRDDCSYYKQT
jgi:hypothetical protein